MNYYLNINGCTVGPMTEQQLFAYNIDQNTNISTDGMHWRPLYTYPELMLAFRQHAGSFGGGFSGGLTGCNLATKKLICGIIAIFLGSFGVQYFILGKTTGGILTIALSIITCGAWSLIMFIQGIVMLCMSDENFKRKYIDNPATMPLF